jgi:hypothetical protein
MMDTDGPEISVIFNQLTSSNPDNGGQTWSLKSVIFNQLSWLIAQDFINFITLTTVKASDLT